MSTPNTGPDAILAAIVAAKLTGYRHHAAAPESRGFFVHVRSRPLPLEERLQQARASMSALKRRRST